MEEEPEIIAITDPVMHGIVYELQSADTAITTAELALRQAQATFDMASRKYAAVRDIAMERLGFDPYADGHTSHTIGVGGPTLNLPSEGRFRFMFMAPGIATVLVLREKGALSLGEIAAWLRAGGFGQVDDRVINAALLKPPDGVVKQADGRYALVEEKQEPE